VTAAEKLPATASGGTRAHLVVIPSTMTASSPGRATAAKELSRKVGRPGLPCLPPVSGSGLLRRGLSPEPRGIRADVRVFWLPSRSARMTLPSLTSVRCNRWIRATDRGRFARISGAADFRDLRRHVERILLVARRRSSRRAAGLGAHENHHEPSSAVAICAIAEVGVVASLNLPSRADGAPKLGVIFSGGNVTFPPPWK